MRCYKCELLVKLHTSFNLLARKIRLFKHVHERFAGFYGLTKTAASALIQHLEAIDECFGLLNLSMPTFVA